MRRRAEFDGLLESLGGLEEPMGIMFSDVAPVGGRTPDSGKKHVCLISYIRLARQKKETVYFAADKPGCIGGWVYMGFILPPPERIAHFVTTGLSGEEGERYMPEPASMHRFFKEVDLQPAPGRYCIIKPLSQFQENEQPEFILFYCRGEVLTGLCQLAYFALDDCKAVEMPFGAGCSNIFAWPFYNKRRGLKKAVVGGIDPSCRPYMKVDELSFTVTPEVFEAMINAVPQSFLTGNTWASVLKRVEKSKQAWKE